MTTEYLLKDEQKKRVVKTCESEIPAYLKPNRSP